MSSVFGYEVLECHGYWKSPNAVIEQDVVVQIGKETLTLYGEGLTVLAHWSLNTIIQLDNINSYHCFAHDTLGNEYLLIDDELMIRALETIALKQTKPKSEPTKWWSFIKFISFLLTLAAIVFYFSENIAESIAGGVIGPKRTEIGEALFTELLTASNSTIQQCQVNNTILDKISNRLFPDERVEIRIVSEGVHSAAMFPGKILVANISQFEITRDKPEVLAGMLLMARLRDKTKDSLVAFLQDAGLLSSIRLLIGREISPYIFTRYVDKLNEPSPIPVSEKELFTEFSRLNLSPEPFAIYLLIENMDPEKFTYDPNEEPHITIPLLEDHEWVALQNSC